MQPTGLVGHPEGGRYREIFRSGRRIDVPGQGERSAITHIYFSLEPGEVSLFHRVGGDEVRNLYLGKGLCLVLWDGHPPSAQTVELSAAANASRHVVPAGTWQAAAPLDDKVLVGCSVAPGFELADFEMLKDRADEARAFREACPDRVHLLGH